VTKRSKAQKLKHRCDIHASSSSDFQEVCWDSFHLSMSAVY